MNYLTPANFIAPVRGHILETLKQRWTDNLIDFIDKLPDLLLIGAIAFVLVRVVSFFANRLRRLSAGSHIAGSVRASQIRTLASILETAGYGIVLFLFAIHVLQVFNINVTPILASAGVVGVAIGFGAQTMVHDVINGILILVENQFNVGDTVKIAALTGTVESMSLRKTNLRDGGDGTLYLIPNSQITTVSNYSRDWSQIQVNIAADFREDASKVISLLAQTAKQIAAEPQYASIVIDQPQVLGVDSFTGSQVIYPVVFKTKSGQQWGISRDFRLRVKALFEQNHMLLGDPNRVYNYPPPAPAPDPTAGNPKAADPATAALANPATSGTNSPRPA